MRFPFFRKKDRAPPMELKTASYIFGIGAVRQMNRQYQALADEGYGANPVAKACIDKIASSVASVEIAVYREQGGKLTRLEKHPLQGLIDNPNPMQSTKELIGDLTRYRLIAGNAYMFGVGLEPTSNAPPRELYLFRPDLVQVKTGNGFMPTAYEYTKSQGQKELYPVNAINGFSAVLHFKHFNPTDSFLGLSPMVSGAYSIDQHNNAAIWNQALLQNSARPSGALVVQQADGSAQSLSEDQYQRLRKQIDQQFSGGQNAGRPMLLEGGLDWREMSLSPKDMDFIEAKHSAAREIAMNYGVPPQLIGLPDAQTFSNYEQARESFWTETVLPMLGDTLDRMNRWLSNVYGPDVYLWYEADTIPALESMRAARSKRLNEDRTLTLNEKREAMGMEAIKGGDTLFVDSNQIPLDLAADQQLAEPGSPAEDEQ